MKAFLAACLAAVVLAAVAWIVLSVVQQPVDQAFGIMPPFIALRFCKKD